MPVTHPHYPLEWFMNHWYILNTVKDPDYRLIYTK